MVFLVGAGWQLSTLAGCASDLFSLASDAAVTWAIMKPLFRPASAVRKGGRRDTPAVDQHGDAPLGNGTDFGDGQAIASQAMATGSAWKLPP
jgi:hypothetical protein